MGNLSLDLFFVKCSSIILSNNLFHFIISLVKTIVRLEIFFDGFNVIKYSFLMAFNQRFEFSYSNNTLNDNNLASKINHQSNRQYLLYNHLEMILYLKIFFLLIEGGLRILYHGLFLLIIDFLKHIQLDQV